MKTEIAILTGGGLGEDYEAGDAGTDENAVLEGLMKRMDSCMRSKDYTGAAKAFRQAMSCCDPEGDMGEEMDS